MVHETLLKKEYTAMAKKDTHLVLGNDLIIHPDVLISNGNGIFGAGNQGSGKSVTLKLLLEQLAIKAKCPLLMFDKEDDITATSALFPRGFLATAGNCPTAKDIYADGLQCIFDLSTWPNLDAAGQMIARTVNALMREAAYTPSNLRVPCIVGMDEASYWVPQDYGKSLDVTTYKLLRDAFESVAARGRKQGLVPFLFTQKFSTISKEVLSPGTYILMRQNVHTEQQRYLDYILPVNEFRIANDRQKKLAIGDLKPGEAIVRFADGNQRIVQFHHCKSEHKSHTPTTQAAISRYANVKFTPNARYGAYVEDEEMDLTETAAPVTGPLPETPVPAPSQLKAGASSGQPKRERQLPTNSIVEPRIRAILAANPGISDSALAKEAHCSYVDAPRWRARILASLPAEAPTQPEASQQVEEKPSTSMTVMEQIAALHASEPSLRQYEIADRLGCDRSNVSRWFAKNVAPAQPEKRPIAHSQIATTPAAAPAHLASTSKRKIKRAAPAAKVLDQDEAELERSIHSALEQDDYLAPSDLAKRFGCDLETAKKHRMSFFSQVNM
jgi:hypothetical protein